MLLLASGSPESFRGFVLKHDEDANNETAVAEGREGLQVDVGQRFSQILPWWRLEARRRRK